jgi:hypothetical protein
MISCAKDGGRSFLQVPDHSRVGLARGHSFEGVIRTEGKMLHPHPPAPRPAR